MLHYLKLDQKEIDRRVGRAVELTGIKDFLHMNPYDVPYSTRKFISIAAILAIETPYIILDEPTAGQDMYGIKALTKLMNVLQDEGKCVITITHDMEFVSDNFSRVVAMANKQIIADGTAREIFWSEDVVKKAKIKKPQIGELVSDLGIGENIILRKELVEILTNKY
jgi:energy-coupling factor transport system ATP-binding protein